MSKIQQDIYLALILLVIFNCSSFSQVKLRDTTLIWKTHSFQLNPDYSMNSYSTADNSRQQVQLNAKVIENNLIRLIVVPEYGARVISFVYKPTGHENIYQSECGSPYGMNDGNFYYDWLMVYGGIFPTFPEPEHGKTWLIPWEYEVIQNNVDTVLVRMEYTDTTRFSRAPGKFNNGITQITCSVEIGVYHGSSLWDFNIRIKNNKDEHIPYEYWTCTTLTPGSEIGNTGSPLNSKLVVPIDQYRAGWSPGAWIGPYNSVNEYSKIDQLSKWHDMGIAYAENLKDNYWGVINSDNGEGIFRISENIETPGLKFWTWGKNNIDNNLYDFSNGGADNYIELWAGVSESFFSDAFLSPMAEKNWSESYCATVNLSSITSINRELAANIKWDEGQKMLFYELQSFKPDRKNRIRISLDGDSYYTVLDKDIITNKLGNSEGIYLENITDGMYTANLEILYQEEILLSATKELNLIGTGIDNAFSDVASSKFFTITYLNDRTLTVNMIKEGEYSLEAFNMSGQLISSNYISGTYSSLTMPSKGVFIIRVSDGKIFETEKIYIN